MDRKRQGNLGEAVALHYYTSLGWDVSLPVGNSSRYDLIADDGESLHRVQCKSTGCVNAYGLYQVTLATSGGNRSWNGKRKAINENECDKVFVYSLNGDMYEFPSSHLNGRSHLSLGRMAEQFKVTIGLENDPIRPEAKQRPKVPLERLCRCGSKMSRDASLCSDCFPATRHVIDWPPVEELRDRVSKSSWVAVAKELGVSDVGLRKHIKNHDKKSQAVSGEVAATRLDASERR